MVNQRYDAKSEEEDETAKFSMRLKKSVLLPKFLLNIEEFDSIVVPQVSDKIAFLAGVAGKKL